LHLILLSTFEVFHHHQFAVLSLLSGMWRVGLQTHITPQRVKAGRLKYSQNMGEAADRWVLPSFRLLQFCKRLTAA